MPPTAPPQGAGAGSSSSGPQSSSARQAEHAEESSPPRTEQELAQAFRDLARGEQAATALEANLTSLESKLDELLASFESGAGAVPSTNGTREGVDGKIKDGAQGPGGQDTTGN